MNLPQAIVGAVLVLSSSILVAARCIAAAIERTRPAGTDEPPIGHFDWIATVMALILFFFGVLTLFIA